MTEADLITSARLGDGQAWEDLVRGHQEPVFRLAYLFLGDADDAQDIAQETFIRAYQSLNRFDNTRPFRPWLMSIAANLARNRMRGLSRYIAALKRLVQADPTALEPQPLTPETGQDVDTLLQAVKKLNLSDQQIIYLRYFLEMTEQETAQTLKIAPGTVKSRLHRALNRLRDYLSTGDPAHDEEAVHEP